MSEQAQETASFRVSDLNYTVPDNAKQFGYSIGGVVTIGFVLLVLTGIVMSFFYSSDVDQARSSVQALSSHPLGLWLRSFHRWTAEAITFLIILHISRIVFTGSYRGARKLNWVFGILLLIVTVTFVFTGTVLKWDQEGYEAYQHAVETLELVPWIGGALASILMGASALMRTYVTHAVVLPVLLGLFIVPHLALMKLNGLSTPPGADPNRTSTFFRHLGSVAIYAAIIYVVIAVLAALFPAELYPGPYSGVELTKPPWLFLVLYAFEDWIGLSALIFVPLVIVVGMIVIPYIDRSESLNSAVRKVIVWGYVVVVAAVVFLTIFVAVTPPATHLEM